MLTELPINHPYNINYRNQRQSTVLETGHCGVGCGEGHSRP